MKCICKLGLILVIVFNILFLNCVHAKSHIDTAIIYYRYVRSGFIKVRTRDSCDFVRMIAHPDSGDTRYNVKEFYKDGKIKLIGKASPRLVTGGGQIALDSNCISYFQNGNRQSFTHYKDGYKDGNEYLFYPNGKIYALKRNFLINGFYQDKILNWECYDANGNIICREGNGKWLIYDKDFKNITVEGSVKDGLMEGE